MPDRSLTTRVGEPPAALAAALRELTGTLEREAEAAGELRDSLVEQRAAVASGEARALDGSVDAISRLLLRLQELRRSRGEQLAALAGDAGLGIEQLAGELEVDLPPRLDEARRALRRAAGEVVREATVNRAVLRRTVESGEAFLQALFSAVAGPAPVYAPVPHPDEGQARGGLLVNRQV